MRKILFSMSIMLVLAINITHAAAAECVNSLEAKVGAITEIIRCLKEIEKENAILKNQVKTLIDAPSSGNAFPKDTIVAFNSKENINDWHRHCPDGWSPFDEARGRIIIGAGVPSNSEFKDWRRIGSSDPIQLTTRKPFESGGEENHIITVSEMPAHNHRVYPHAGFPDPGSQVSGAHGGDETTRVRYGETNFMGDGKPHNTMPPFIALYYCK